MKKWLALLLAAVMVFSLSACGEKGTESTPAAQESALTAEQQMIVDAVSAQIQSKNFAQWQELAEQFKAFEAAVTADQGVTDAAESLLETLAERNRKCKAMK